VIEKLLNTNKLIALKEMGVVENNVVFLILIYSSSLCIIIGYKYCIKSVYKYKLFRISYIWIFCL